MYSYIYVIFYIFSKFVTFLITFKNILTGPSDESTTSGSTIETSTHVAYDVASTTTTVTVKTENETMYTSSSHEYNYTEMKRMASDQPGNC